MGSRKIEIWDLAGVAACGGVACGVLQAGPRMYITGQTHADPSSFEEEIRDDTTRNAVMAALLNVA